MKRHDDTGTIMLICCLVIFFGYIVLMALINTFAEALNGL